MSIAERTAARVSEDPFGDYLRQIGRVPLLVAEEEIELARRIEVGVLAAERLATTASLTDEQRRELAWLERDGQVANATFVRSNLRLVVSIAKRYAGRGLAMMDLIQEGNLGLMRAVEKFDFKAGNKFSTYATWWIRQAIVRGIADTARLIRVPVHTFEKMERLDRVRRDLAAELGRTPTLDEVAEEAQVDAKEISRLSKLRRETVSLGTLVGDDNNSELGDLIEDADGQQPFDAVALGLQSEDIRRRLDELPSRDASVLRMRFGLDGNAPLTLDEVGELCGITRERVRQLEIRSLRRMRSPELLSYLA